MNVILQYRTILILICTAILAGCSRQKLPVPAVNINIAGASRLCVRTCEQDTSTLLYYYRNDSLFLFNVQQNSSGCILAADSLFSRENIISSLVYTQYFHIHTPDSIFFLCPESNRILLLDRNCNITHQWAINCPLSGGNKKYVLFTTLEAPLMFQNNCIYSGASRSDISIGDREGRALFYRTPVETEIIIKNDSFSVSGNKGRFPEAYLNGDNYYDFNPARTITRDGKLIYSFGICSDLLLYQPDGTEEKIPCKSRYESNIFPMEETGGKSKDFVYRKKYAMEQTRYYNIIYDKYRERYYRLVQLSTPYSRDDGTINIFHDWSAIVMDEQFNILDEIRFDKDSFNPFYFLPVREGLLIGRTDRENWYDDTLRLTLFRYETD